ncbi:MAG: DUF2863 family protein [Burkholderiaceae bacterium]
MPTSTAGGHPVHERSSRTLQSPGTIADRPAGIPPFNFELAEMVAVFDAFSKTAGKAPLEEITSVLHEVGLIHIKHLSEHFPMEFCDDCGAPLFPDAESELMHAEMPEDVPQSTGHFH